MDDKLPPAGFYPDPENPGRQRWWNGSAWSESGDTASAVEEPPKRGIFAFWFGIPTWRIVTVAVVWLVVGILFRNPILRAAPEGMGTPVIVVAFIVPLVLLLYAVIYHPMGAAAFRKRR